MRPAVSSRSDVSPQNGFATLTWATRPSPKKVRAYVWLAGYLAVRGFEEGPTRTVLYTTALGLHFLSLDFTLSREYGRWYEAKARYAFAAAPLAGWAVGIFAGFSQFFTAALLGFLSGGIILNAIASELPDEKEGRLLYFVLGGVFYTALLIAIS